MSPDCIRDLTNVALRQVIAERRRTGSGPRALGDCLHEPCETARAHGVRPEELIVIVKHCWRGLADAARLDLREDTLLLGEVVTACINEYYRKETER